MQLPSKSIRLTHFRQIVPVIGKRTLKILPIEKNIPYLMLWVIQDNMLINFMPICFVQNKKLSTNPVTLNQLPKYDSSAIISRKH